MSDCEYVRNYYGVPACIGRLVIYKGEQGVISRDGGNYICVNFDKDKPGVTCNIHPTDPNITYLREAGRIVELRCRLKEKL